MAEIEYAVNDKVFAKMKGHPVWPAKVSIKIKECPRILEDVCCVIITNIPLL